MSREEKVAIVEAYLRGLAGKDLSKVPVYANHALTHKLNEFGIVHEAEEFNGLWDANSYWDAEGRVITDVLPFFEHHLAF